MPSSLRIFVPFSKAEIYDVDDMLLLACSDQVVIGFDVSVEEPILVNILYPLKLQS
jgi:hypothetical protein